MAAASLNLLYLTPKALSLHRSSALSSSSLFTLRPVPKLVLKLSSISSNNYSSSRFVRRVAVSSELEEDEEEDDFEEDEGNDVVSPDAKLFVGNLPFSVDSAALAGLFEQAGNVEMVEVIYDRLSGRSRGFAFVTMASAQEAEAAAQQLNGYELDGRPIRVNSGPPPPKRETSSFGGNRGQDREFSSFRGNRGQDREYSSFGGRGRERENSSYGGRGRERENSSFGGRGRERGSFDNSNRVYVGNLSWGVDDETLERVFGEQGRVKEARVVYDKESGRSRGFGFVTYGSSEEVNNAVESLDGLDLNGRSIRVSPAEARQPRQF